MTFGRTALLAGIAAIALAGLPRLAAAEDAARHVLTVQLPDGQIEQIQYTGDIAPRVVFVPGAPRALAPVALVGAPSPFAMLEAMSAQMDQEMAGLMHQVEMMTAPAAGPGGLTEAAFGNLPQGVTEYRSVSTLTPNGVCTQTIRITGAADGARPRMISQTTGSCGTDAQPAAAPTIPAPVSQPHTIQVRDLTPAPSRPTYHG